MAIKATEIYRQATPEFDEETQALLRADANPLAVDRFRRLTVPEQRAAIRLAQYPEATR